MIYYNIFRKSHLRLDHCPNLIGRLRVDILQTL